VRIGVADPAGCNSDQDFGRADLWKWKLGIFHLCADLHELDSSHKTRDRLVLMLAIMMKIPFAANTERRSLS